MSLADVMINGELAAQRRRQRSRDYYRRNAAKLKARIRHRQQMRHWCAWLLANLEWPVEPTPIYPDPYPIRRPLLRLPRKVT